MAKLSIAQRVIAEKTVCILLVRGESPDGRKIYAYVAIRADRLEAFMEAQRNGLFHPEDFGMVIESGEGEPSPEVKERMTREYGFNHQATVDIPDAAKAGELAGNLPHIPPQSPTASTPIPPSGE